MTRRPATAFDDYVGSRMKDPEFAAEYAAARAEIDAIDAVVRGLDAAREKRGMTKAELAKRADMKPEVVRRLFTAEKQNPTLSTVVKVAAALDFRLDLVPRRAATPSRAARKTAR
jgi:DNA-binding phage protein